VGDGVANGFPGAVEVEDQPRPQAVGRLQAVGALDGHSRLVVTHVSDQPSWHAASSPEVGRFVYVDPDHPYDAETVFLGRIDINERLPQRKQTGTPSWQRLPKKVGCPTAFFGHVATAPSTCQEGSVVRCHAG
jgi:hypothetical protein